MRPRSQRKCRKIAGTTRSVTALLLWLVVSPVTTALFAGPRVEVTPESWLSEIAAARRADGTLAPAVTFHLKPGHYRLEPQAYVDTTCGNCEDPFTPVAATVGLIVSGQRIVITGMEEGPEAVVIQTGAGYGLLFRDCQDCRITAVTVTGGVRDPDPNATDAAIVVQRSRLEIEDCLIRDNLGDSTVVANTVVGVMGIAGREGSEISIRNNRIVRNSWDGIALYRGAQAEIVDNVVDGVDKATGPHLGGGRGVGIGVTWDAHATITLNLVTRYWKGIGVFVDAQADLHRNVIEDILTWGIAYWDAGRGRPVVDMVENVVYATGACGIAITREAAGPPLPGSCRGNVLVKTGQNAKYDDPEYYCRQSPLAIHALPVGFLVADNLYYDNRTSSGGPAEGDLTLLQFRQAAMPLLKLLQCQPAFRSSRCFRELGVPGSDSLYR